MLKYVILTILAVGSLANILSAQDTISVVKIEDLIEEMKVSNQGIKSKLAMVKRDSALITVTGSLPDPVISFNLLNLPVNTFSFNQEPMTGKQIAARQSFPFFGTLSLREEVASKGTEAAYEDYREFVNHKTRDLTHYYNQLFFAEKAIVLTKTNEELLQNLFEIVQTKYRVGKGIQQDVLKVQVELSRMTEDLINFKQKYHAVEAMLNGLLNRPANQKIGRTSELSLIPIGFDPQKLIIKLKTARPELKKWQQISSQAQSAIELAKKKYWPDMSAFVAYTFREELTNGGTGIDFFSAGINLSIPLYSGSKQSQLVDGAIFRKQSADNNYTDIFIMQQSNLEKYITEAEKNAQLYDLYKNGILAQAQQALESALIGYQTDKIDFITLFNNFITLYKLEINYYRIITDYNQNIADIEYVIGSKLLETIE